MLTRRLLLSICLCCVWAMPAQSAEDGADAGDEPRAEETVADTGSGTEEGGDAAEDASPPGGSVGGQMGEVTLERFIPSEEITADGAVSFPVDI